MTLMRCFACGWAFVVGLSLAMANDVYYGQTEQESIFVAALNEYRTARGLHPVAVSAELSRDCRGWSTRMRQRGQLSHDPTAGTEICAQIATESGISALRVWQRSPAHNAILLSPRIDTIGIGSDGLWWTMRGSQANAERTVSRSPGTRHERSRAEITEVTVAQAEVAVIELSRAEIAGAQLPRAVIARAEQIRAAELARAERTRTAITATGTRPVSRTGMPIR